MWASASPRIVGRHFPALDGLRALAVLAVVIFHAGIVVAPHTELERLYFTLVSSGWVGVDLFFVLSGFLITGILLDTFGTTGYFVNFYMRRVLRIFPLYYAVLLAAVVLGAFATASTPHTWLRPTALSYWVYLENWVYLFGRPPIREIEHFWSLAIEEQFYLFWPALIALTASRGRAGALCFATIALAIGARWTLVAAGKPAYFFTVSRMDALACGAMLAVYLRRHGSFDQVRTIARRVAIGAATAVAGIALWRNGFYGHDPEVLRYGLLPLALIFAAGLALTLSAPADSRWRALLEAGPVRAVGRVSYGVYVFHWPIAILLKAVWPVGAFNFWMNQFAFALVLATVSIAAAAFSYRYFESWFLARKARFAARAQPVSGVRSAFGRTPPGRQTSPRS